MFIKIKKKIKKLKKKINKYSFYYFNKNKNLISNRKFDFLIKKLEKIEKKYPILNSINSPTKKIYYKFLKQFKTSKHNIPMLSIKSEYSVKKIYQYIEKIKKKYPKINFCCELKIDGVAISLIYKKNILYKSLTRGNGIYGENITKNVKVINSIPKKIKTKIKYKYLEIRGEIFIKKNIFNNLNNNKSFSNSRNFTSGTIRLLNKNIIKKRKLSFIGYDLIINKKRNFITKQSKSLKIINSIGFKIDKKKIITSSFKKIINFYKKIKKKRKNINFEIDGIIIKINNKNIQEKIKYNNKYIKWAIAWKFSPQKKTTKLINIKYKVGKNGIITPIGIIKPINIGGVNIKKINLYNLNYLKKLSINKKDKIVIERSGDVIPKISKIISNNKKNNKKFNIINKCPSCKKKININVKKPKCNFNLTCPKQLEKILINFISKNGFNISNIGPKIIKKLIKYKYINCISDILKLNKKILTSIPKIKIKLANKIYYSIYYAIKKIKIKNFIYSLSIPNIGISTSIYLSKKIKKIKEFINLKKKKNIKISKLKYTSIITYLSNKNNLKQIKILYNIIKDINNSVTF